MHLCSETLGGGGMDGDALSCLGDATCDEHREWDDAEGPYAESQAQEAPEASSQTSSQHSDETLVRELSEHVRTEEVSVHIGGPRARLPIRCLRTTAGSQLYYVDALTFVLSSDAFSLYHGPRQIPKDAEIDRWLQGNKAELGLCKRQPHVPRNPTPGSCVLTCMILRRNFGTGNRRKLGRLSNRRMRP